MNKEIYEKAEAEIMDNIYELIRINFDSDIIADATQIVGGPLQEALDTQKLQLDAKYKFGLRGMAGIVETQTKKKLLEEIEKIEVWGGGSGRRLKIQVMGLLEDK